MTGLELQAADLIALLPAGALIAIGVFWQKLRRLLRDVDGSALVLDEIRSSVAKHDTADAVLAENVSGLDKRMDRLEKTMDAGFAAVNKWLDGILDRAA